MPAALLDALDHAHSALIEPFEAAAQLRALSDAALVEALEKAAGVRRLVDARSALLAGEVARRSAPALAHSGLAQRHGHRTPDELVRVATGSTRRDARLAVQAGVMLNGAESPASDLGDSAGTGDAGMLPALPSWARILVEPVRAGALSLGALDAIRSGLGEVTEAVTATELRAAAQTLLVEATSLDVDRLYRRARQLRDDLDADGIAEREARRRDARSLRLYRGGDGMTRASWLLDPESAAIVTELYDRATSPRRGGPTFLAPDDAALVERMRGDERTPEQYASDAFLDLLIAGSDADASALLSTGAPSVRVLVTADDLARGSGAGHLEGQSEPVALPTVERMLCAGTHTPILLASSGQPLDVGRTQRLFTARQRLALAARDGGCRWAGCERPPSWCEAHHIEPWVLKAGRTDVADGILLCRHHHLLVHNNGWRIERHRGAEGVDEYRARPPSALDPEQTPLPMPSRSEPLRRALQPPRPRTTAA